MTTPASQEHVVAKFGLLAVGLVLLLVALVFDPVGTSPDSGVIDLGPSATRWLLGGLGGGALVAAAWAHFSRKTESGPEEQRLDPNAPRGPRR